MRHKRTLRWVALLAALMLGAAACGDSNGGTAPPANGNGNGDGNGGEEQEHLQMSFGTTSSASSAFAFLTAHARLAGNHDGALTINVRETAASSENIQLANDGTTEWGISGFDTLVQFHRGIGPADGNPFPDLRHLYLYLVAGEYVIVRADSGVETLQDLAGMSFAPGLQGSATYNKFEAIFDALDIEINAFDGSLEDVVNAIKDGRAIGMAKTGNGLGPDAAMLDIASAVDVRIIPFTQDDIDAVYAADDLYRSLFLFQEIPAGSIFDNPEPMLSSTQTASYFTMEGMPEDDAYRLTKALWETQETAAEETSYASTMDITFESTRATLDILPMHPGAERYFREIGEL